MAKYDVFGMCNALFDLQVEVEDEQLKDLGYAKGGMFLIGPEQQSALISTVRESVVNTAPGGSGANSVYAVNQLGGKAVFTSHVADDDFGAKYRNGLEDLGVKANLGVGGASTGVCVVLITPDSERTMCTHLGSSIELKPEDVVEDDVRDSEYLYVTAYLWDQQSQKEAVLKAMRAANRSGTKVALSLSDPFCVERHKDEILQLVRSHVDLLIGNAEEAMLLLGADNKEDAARGLSEYSDLAVVTDGANGSYIVQDGNLKHLEATKIKPVDTTGAGDAYAGALLTGITQGKPLDETVQRASKMAAKVVAQFGPRLEKLPEDL
jgi:hypothetical protein